MKKTNLTNLAYSLILLISLILINKNLPFKKPLNPESYSTLSSDFTKIVSFGNYRMISSFLWAKTLLDADIQHITPGERSWLFYRFRLISDLDPTFYENYLHGGVYLSIIKDDIYSASEIFEKGLSYYPNDFKLLYNAAFNYHFQIKDFDRSLELYKQINKLPERLHFRILPKLIEQAKEKVSSKESHLSILYNKLKRTKDPQERKAITEKIRKIKGQQ